MLKTLIFVYAMAVGVLGTSLVGSVKDKETNNKIPNVQIIINKTDTIYTDEAGEFKFLLEDELKSVEINHPGYESKNYVYVVDEVKDKKTLRKEKRKMKKEGT